MNEDPKQDSNASLFLHHWQSCWFKQLPLGHHSQLFKGKELASTYSNMLSHVDEAYEEHHSEDSFKGGLGD